MSVRTSHPSMPTSPKTVASLANANMLSYAFSPAECDIIELRLDAMVSDLPEAKEALMRIKQSPLQSLITVRCESEGGQSKLAAKQRSQLIMGLSPLATFIDIELANFTIMQEAIDFSKSMNNLVIASFHDFKKTPPIEILRDKIKESIDAGADIAKIAVHHNSIEDVYQCAKLLQETHPIAISLMGMGSLGPTSRLLYAQLGSVLNYGYLGNKPTAPGQWPASLLHKAIASTPPF